MISKVLTGKKMEHEKSAVRCKVEHPFLIVKKQMGYSKVVYRGIAKNMHRFHMLFASANLILCSRAGRTKDFIGSTVSLRPFLGNILKKG